MKRKLSSIVAEWGWNQHPHLLFILTPDGKIAQSNDIAGQRLGIAVPDLVGRHLTTVRDRGGRYYLGLAPFAQVLRTKQAVAVNDKFAHHYYQVQYVPLLGNDGEIEWIIVTFADFTDLVALVRANEELTAQMSHAAKLASVGELAAGVGHEINNPLAVLSGQSYLFEMKYQKNTLASDDLEKLICVQKEAISRIKVIVEGLRSYARMDNEQVQTVDLNLMVRDTLNFLRSIYQREGVEIECNLAVTTTPIFVSGNWGRLQQVIVNLLSNAKDACAKRRLKVIRINSGIDGTIATLKIADNGEGITPENLQRIFNPFFTTKEVGKGTGMGLKIVKNIVEKTGGTISIESELDVGTTIELRLPLQKAV